MRTQAGAQGLMAVCVTLLMTLTTAGCPPPDDDEDGQPLRAAWIYIGTPGDVGWTFAHDQGRRDAEAAFENLETTYVENVPEGGETTVELNKLVDEGYDIIFTTSWGFMEQTHAVALENPDIYFEHCSGYMTADNMTNYFGRIYQARYLTGMVAGNMTTSNLIGYVAAFPIPEVIRGINAFTLGARSVNSSAVVMVQWTNTWFDPLAEGTAANALITQGVDVMAQHQDSTAAVSAADDAGIYAIGYHSDMAGFAPDAVLTSAVWNWGTYYTERIRAVSEDSWTNDPYWGGLDDGIVDYTPIADAVPASVQSEVARARREIAAGELAVFEGPFNHQDGTAWKAAGESMTDDEMLNVMEFVEGVIGSIN